MPTMTDSKTGETKEVSMEELMKMLRESGGDFAIQQVVTDQDGNQQVTDVYGNISGQDDGLDRSVNVFIKLDDTPFFAGIFLRNSPDYPQEPKSEGKGWVTTIDFLDHAVTFVLTGNKEKEKLEAKLFMRDERKSNLPSNLIDSMSWSTSNGEMLLNISAEDLEKQCLLYMIISMGIRRYLYKTGLLQELKQLNNKGAGVLITMDGNKPCAKIVRGKQRPDLPCNVFLLGEQMCRPYIDEIMGATSPSEPPKPTANKPIPDKTETPEERARREHAEDLRRIKERRTPTDYNSYRNAYREWEKECDRVREKRTKACQDRIEIKKKELEAKANRTLEETKNRQKKLIKEATDRQQKAETALKAAGFFKFSEKKALRATIEKEDAAIAAANQTITAAEEEYRAKTQDGGNEMHACVVEARTAAMRQNPMPAEPKDPNEPNGVERMKREEKAEILYAIGDGACYTKEEIMRMVGEDESTLTRRVRELIQEGRVVNVEIDHKWYTRIC